MVLKPIIRKNRRMPVFIANYPRAKAGEITLMPTPQRMGALPQYTGKGVVIAFLDNGFYAHPDLADRIIIYADATNKRIIEGRPLNKAYDTSWHGLMTSAIACGSGRLSNGYFRGIACDAQLVLVKVSNEQRQIKEPDILRGLRWVMGNLTRFNIHIVNLSVGGDFVSNDPDHSLYRAVHNLTAAGVTVVAAAGNREAYVVPPASAPQAIAVGGFNDRNTLDRSRWTGYHSNYGLAYDGTPKPDVVAPAMWIASPILPKTSVAREARWLAPMLKVRDEKPIRRIIAQGQAAITLQRYLSMHPGKTAEAVIQERIWAHKLVDTHYQHVDGTSVAAPIVSSVVAQMLEANPSLKPEQIRKILMQTATQLDNIPTERQGAGAINAADAVRAAINLS